MLLAGRSGFSVTAGAKYFSVPQMFRPAVRPTQLPSQYVPDSFGAVKQSGREFNHTSPTSSEVTNEWCHIFTPSVCPYIVDRKSFTFYFFFIVKEIKDGR
jgi:hypothetical protein